MKKSILLILGILSFMSCNENNSENINKDNNQKTQSVPTKFPSMVNSCENIKHLLNAIPHVDHVADYNFVSVQCVGNIIVAKYKHKIENYTFQVIIYEEKEDKKPMYSTGLFLYEITSKQEVNGNKISDLKTFENAVMTIKKNKEYYNISYYGTYKENFSIAITIQGKELSNKQKTDDFLVKYLGLFKKEALN